ncbi:hemin uptake protein HemP [Nitrincola tapanii]|nr:hemin uptake protein HemP [Nitrincola tapanii]
MGDSLMPEKAGAVLEQGSPSSVATQAPRIKSEILLSNLGRLEIEHENEIYRLSRTKSGKLILTK